MTVHRIARGCRLMVKKNGDSGIKVVEGFSIVFDLPQSMLQLGLDRWGQKWKEVGMLLWFGWKG